MELVKFMNLIWIKHHWIKKINVIRPIKKLCKWIVTNELQNSRLYEFQSRNLHGISIDLNDGEIRLWRVWKGIRSTVQVMAVWFETFLLHPFRTSLSQPVGNPLMVRRFVNKCNPSSTGFGIFRTPAFWRLKAVLDPLQWKSVSHYPVETVNSHLINDYLLDSTSTLLPVDDVNTPDGDLNQSW